VDSGDVIVVLVVVAALSFDFTNGFHDTANAMATTIATGALRPKLAVTIAALLNFVGAFISLKVAATVAGGIVDAGAITPTVVFGGLIGAIAWNLTTWWFGLPSSSSHALIGGIVGATLAAVGAVAGSGVGRPGAAVNWRVADNIVVGWLFTLPAAAAVAAAVYGVIDVLGGGETGVIVVSAAMAVAAILLWRANRAKPIEPDEAVSENPAFGPAARPQPVTA